MSRRKFTREFNPSAVKSVNEQGFSMSDTTESLGFDRWK